MKRITLVGGQEIIAHELFECEGNFCCIHRPSSHHMEDWPQNWREDRSLMERICPHGIGHPDPDDLGIREGWQSGIHGCDGCCIPKEI